MTRALHDGPPGAERSGATYTVLERRTLPHRSAPRAMYFYRAIWRSGAQIAKLYISSLCPHSFIHPNTISDRTRAIARPTMPFTTITQVGHPLKQLEMFKQYDYQVTTKAIYTDTVSLDLGRSLFDLLSVKRRKSFTSILICCLEYHHCSMPWSAIAQGDPRRAVSTGKMLIVLFSYVSPNSRTRVITLARYPPNQTLCHLGPSRNTLATHSRCRIL